MRTRLWEVDVLRTAAIVMMVVYHAAYDVDFLTDAGPNVRDGLWRALQVACASTFVSVVGIAAWVRHARLAARGIHGWEAWKLNRRRGLQIAGAALLVSAATYVALDDRYVRFGILHLIAVAHLVVLPLCVRFGEWCALPGALLVLAGLAIKGSTTTFAPLLVIGLDPGEAGVDWVPLLPWIGVAMLGVAAGAWAYPAGERRPSLEGLGEGSELAWRLGAPGRRSLTIYLVHQLVLIAVIAGVLTLLGVSLDGV